MNMTAQDSQQHFCRHLAFGCSAGQPEQLLQKEPKRAQMCGNRVHKSVAETGGEKKRWRKW